MEECTGLILAGGKSSRMGCNKAFLQLDGKSLFQWQVEKFREMGVREILISGPGNLECSGVRAVADIYANCGPIGGLHTGLTVACCEHCLVIGVDMPLIPEKVFLSLCNMHEGGVTILSHSGKEEPLLGIYDRSIVPMLEKMIQNEEYAIRKLRKYVPFRCVEVYGMQAEWLCNCNSPEDYERAKRILADSSSRELVPDTSCLI